MTNNTRSNEQGTLAGTPIARDNMAMGDTELDVDIITVAVVKAQHHGLTPNVAGIDAALRMARNRTGEYLNAGDKARAAVWTEIANDIYVNAFGPIGMP